MFKQLRKITLAYLKICEKAAFIIKCECCIIDLIYCISQKYLKNPPKKICNIKGKLLKIISIKCKEKKKKECQLNILSKDIFSDVHDICTSLIGKKFAKRDGSNHKHFTQLCDPIVDEGCASGNGKKCKFI